MTDDRSPTGTHRLLATDQVLVGATLRDRFLTAFILRNAGSFTIAAQPEAARYPGELDMGAASFLVVQSVPLDGNGYEPPATGMIELFFTDEEDDV